MRVVVIGGKLQGTEVTYLSKAAGYETVVLDSRENAQACGIADKSICVDILQEPERAKAEIAKAYVVIPAMEDEEVLEAVVAMGKETGVPVVFDLEAYAISSSKLKSNELFRNLGVSMPQPYPDCEYPVVIKPDDQSGSAGVRKAFSKEEAEAILKDMPANTVVQEYLEGRSFSLEVIGDGQNYIFPQITEVVVDKEYDCKRIVAPAKLSSEEITQLYDMGKVLAKGIGIRGIFDIEVISHNGKLKILEIDARMPSQTPISVYQSCGINMVELLARNATGESISHLIEDMHMAEIKEHTVCLYQQIVVTEESISVLGEHVMGQCGKLHIENDFFGAYQAITDYEPGKKIFCAIVIVKGKTQEEAYRSFLACIEKLKEQTRRNEAVLIEG